MVHSSFVLVLVVVVVVVLRPFSGGTGELPPFAWFSIHPSSIS
jgi:hypothetical protein